MKKKIGICHYRIGKTDGVSLEIQKRKRIFEELGHKVILIAGSRQIGADYIIPELEFDRPEIVKIKENSFFKFKDYNSDEQLKQDIDKTANNIELQFNQIHKRQHFDLLFLHNIFSHGRHISAAKSFYNIAHKTNINVIAVNHDFYWIGSYKDIYKPQTPYVKAFLEKYVPPSLPHIKHVTINSINQKALEDRISKKSLIIPDTFDFKQKPWIVDKYNRDFLKTFGLIENDLIILQATRITSRKGIEVALEFVHELNLRKTELMGKTLYNGKKITQDSDFVFVFSNYPEKDSLDYLKKLKQKILKLNINAKFIYEQIDSKRRKQDGKKIYSLWDSYVYADLVTYPSWWEGWGNQFIEAVFAKKPVVVFQYPVFKADIKPEGYDIISLGDKFTKTKDNLIQIPQKNLKKAVETTLSTLTNPKTNQVLEKNYSIGNKYHSEEALKKLLLKFL